MYRKSLKVPCFLIITGCATFGKPSVKSDWEALSESKSLDCREVPLLPEDLKIDRVHIVESTGPSLVLEVTNRKGVRNFYHLPYRKKSNLETSSLVRLPVTQDAKFLGAGISGGKAVLVIHATSKEKPVIQVRDLSNNVLLNEFPTKLKAFEVSDWKVDGDKLFSLIREDKDDEAMDDQPFQELIIPLGSPKGLSLSPSKAIGVGAETFKEVQGRRYTFTLDRGLSAAKKEPRFKISAWSSGPKVSAVELEEKGPIESWRVLENPRGLNLAFVKGDSLLWENTSLEAVQLSTAEPFTKQSSASLPLSRVHVAQPLLASSAKGTFIFLPQWLDHEITVGAYELLNSEIKSLGYLGVFKEGTTFEEAFYHEPSESFYLVARLNTSPAAKYQLCEVEI